MAQFEVVVANELSELFDTAVFRFLELKAQCPEDGVVELHTEPYGGFAKKRLRLWSDGVVGDFASYWASFPKHNQSGLLPRSRPAFAARG